MGGQVRCSSVSPFPFFLSVLSSQSSISSNDRRNIFLRSNFRGEKKRCPPPAPPSPQKVAVPVPLTPPPPLPSRPGLSGLFTRLGDPSSPPPSSTLSLVHLSVSCVLVLFAFFYSARSLKRASFFMLAKHFIQDKSKCRKILGKSAKGELVHNYLGIVQSWASIIFFPVPLIESPIPCIEAMDR
jgi:hypothetical protein